MGRLCPCRFISFECFCSGFAVCCAVCCVVFSNAGSLPPNISAIAASPIVPSFLAEPLGEFWSDIFIAFYKSSSIKILQINFKQKTLQLKYCENFLNKKSRSKTTVALKLKYVKKRYFKTTSFTASLTIFSIIL